MSECGEPLCHGLLLSIWECRNFNWGKGKGACLCSVAPGNSFLLPLASSLLDLSACAHGINQHPFCMDTRSLDGPLLPSYGDLDNLQVKINLFENIDTPDVS